MSSKRRRPETRVVVGGALLLSLSLGALAACLFGLPGSGVPSGAVGAGASSASGSRGGAALAAGASATSSGLGPSAGSSIQTTAPTATSSPTRAPTPPAFQATHPPTPEPSRLYHVPVLMYHRIIPTSEAGDSLPDLVVSPETFSVQMKALFDAGWHSITMATLADDMETDRTIPAKTFVITFDDGWYDGYVYAFPIMREYGFVGTFYVITSRINSADFLSTQELRTLEAAGNDIGNHTLDHISLQTVPLARVKQEVEKASEAIERAVGHRPVSLAYPMGGISMAVVMVLGDIPDMKLAVHTGFGTYETWLGRFDMPRVRIHPGSSPKEILAWLSM